ncbi:ENTS family enterobactin (siderophore) exporter [Nonomuraea thailandensis]|uniref:ENTS family enterobactin (Siderophore) exporter n=1 Tax=Nonomuraea thailandensis TaxID=1188745 RepID=A0A9X2H2P1_9ACTN|nr:enterobactin transporter EntS [Nonomuraea thailandensis]MCP2365463.1 ENTS family enterobactin (siderophore) exporter [Nonomuraea thailandensis]
MRLALDVAPLRNPAFRRVFLARTVALFGIGFVMVAVPLQVFALTGSTAGVAFVSVAVGGSALAGTMLGGMLADRGDRRRLIIGARATAAIAFAVLAGNALLPEPQLWVIYLCGIAEGVANGVSGSALMAATPSIVPRDKLAAAGALMAVMADLGSVAAPALGGLLVSATGFWGNYAVCAVAGTLTVTLLGRLPPLPPPETATRESLPQALRAVAGYVRRDRIVGPTLLAGLVAGLLSGWNVLLPAFGQEVLGLRPDGLGLLYAAPAAGALVGSLTSGWMGSVARPGRFVMGALLLSGAGLVVVGLTGWFAVAIAGLVLFGAGRVVGDVLRYTIVQEHTPDQYRGRLAALWSAQITVGVSLGAAAAGGLSAFVPAGGAFPVYGALGMAGAVVLALLLSTLRRLRRS